MKTSATDSDAKAIQNKLNAIRQSHPEIVKAFNEVQRHDMLNAVGESYPDVAEALNEVQRREVQQQGGTPLPASVSSAPNVQGLPESSSAAQGRPEANKDQP